MFGPERDSELDPSVAALCGVLPADEGAVVEQARVKARDELVAEHRRGDEPVSWADALVHLSETYLGGATAPPAERYQVMVHVRGDRPARDASLHLGPALPASLRRYRSCDATVRLLLEDGTGPVALGRRCRTVPTPQRRIIEARDRGCRVPGCATSRWLHVHHLVHGEDGGSTDPTNPVCLCRAHHRAHHRGELLIEGDPTTADGLVVTERRPGGSSPASPARAHPRHPRPRRPGPWGWPRRTGATRAASDSTAAGSSSPEAPRGPPYGSGDGAVPCRGRASVDISMTLPTMVPHGRAEVLSWCRGADEGPFASLAVPERITYPSHSWVVQLSAAAALTERVRLWTTVVVLPAHDAVETAKHLASVDRLSGGRLTVGLGVGQREHDYRAIGGDMRRRWARLDEQVATMRSIWAGEPPFAGADPVGPPPTQPGGPPLVAGVMGPKGLARAARWAAGVDDGASVFGVDGAAAAATFERIRAAWRAAGRASAPHISASLWYALGPGAEDRLRRYCFDYLRSIGEGVARTLAARATCHSPEALRGAVRALEHVGCDELFLVPTTADVTELDRTRLALGR